MATIARGRLVSCTSREPVRCRRCPAPEPAPWWRSGVVYQVYPRSFSDADGDGVGDLEGVRRHLDHLAWLGVDAVWLSPFYRSPMADFGYDVADFCDVDPLFGDLAAFDRLLAEAHDLGIRVLVDLVPNHTSDQHPWFQASRRSRDDPKRDWYVWRDGGGPTAPAEQLAGRLHRGRPGLDLGRRPPSSGTSTSSSRSSPT